MSRYIDKDKVLKIVNDMTECEDDYERITEWVHNMPSIDIVQCKECKYASDNHVYGCMCNHFNDNDWDYHRMYANDFCSRGERKESER